MKNLNYKTMRKLVFTLLMLLTLSLNAQENKGTLKFLGIPVDGTKSEMISQLKKKGFTYNAYDDYLEGVFNGHDVNIRIGTNNNKVYRVFVADKVSLSEREIKIRYNTLLNQFKNNQKYLSLDENKELGYDFDISNEITNNRIEAGFIQITDNIEESVNNSVWFMIYKYGYDEYGIWLYYDNLLNYPNGDDL